MSIDRQYGKVVFTCDECDDTLETDMRDFGEALRAVKDAGWFAHRDDDDMEWVHVCPDCLPRLRP